ncbi:Hsp70 family protein [Dactylosporangium sp. CA-139066]|uniref:Hsp70 family protein n=1 Tax=Dactylosporangium sp. CA-139066 TaxID=3239930 RepID=UPI003D8C942A
MARIGIAELLLILIMLGVIVTVIVVVSRLSRRRASAARTPAAPSFRPSLPIPAPVPPSPVSASPVSPASVPAAAYPVSAPPVASPVSAPPASVFTPSSSGPHLGIDFGTSNTAAVLRTADGRRLPLLFDGSPMLPSAVFAAENGRIAVGRDALHLARTAPERFEPSPKRCIDDGHVLLGDREYAVADVIAAVLARVLDEARHTLDGATPSITVTHPAAWGPTRRDTLLAAAQRAGAPAADLLPEPIAAARFLTRLHGATVQPDAAIVVYDFGAGTFDATVLLHRDGRFNVAATEGLTDTGGRDIDAALLQHIAGMYAARDAATWQRLERPATPADHRARWTLLDDVRTAKEMLSRAPSTLIHLPLFEDELLLTRDHVEALAGPIVDRTVAATKSALWAAGPAAARVGAVFLVGGSSRIPLAATALHRAIAVPPTTLERPETVVAEGAAAEVLA